MLERGIQFCGWKVRAILKGAGQTRRIINPQPILVAGKTWEWPCESRHDRPGPCDPVSKASWADGVNPGDCMTRFAAYPVGTIIYIRETWGDLNADHPRCPDGRKPQPGDRIVYRANPADDYQWGSGKPSQGSFCWRSGRFMPRWAARPWRGIVTAVRAERLQEITEQDAQAEGVAPLQFHEGHIPEVATYIGGFARAWDDLHGPGAWAQNPWVFPYTFEECRP